MAYAAYADVQLAQREVASYQDRLAALERRSIPPDLSAALSTLKERVAALESRPPQATTASGQASSSELSQALSDMRQDLDRLATQIHELRDSAASADDHNVLVSRVDKLAEQYHTLDGGLGNIYDRFQSFEPEMREMLAALTKRVQAIEQKMKAPVAVASSLTRTASQPPQLTTVSVRSDPVQDEIDVQKQKRLAGR